MTSVVFQHLPKETATLRYCLSPNRNLFAQRLPAVDAGDPKTKIKEIHNYVHCTMELFEKVFESVSFEEGFFVQPIHKLRHPLIFYYAHTVCFYINKLTVAGLTTRICPKFEEMFAVGVDEMSWDDLNEGHYEWPTVKEVMEYRLAVRERVNSLMTSGEFSLNLPLTFASSMQSSSDSFWWLMLMCSEHERIHVETASVHVRELPMNFINSAMSDYWKRCQEVDLKAPMNELIEVAEGKVYLGRKPDSKVYGWDCDYSDGNYLVDVPSFKASKYIVSNAEFFAFMEADGYNTQRYWDEEGWRWVQWKKPQHPWFWVRDVNRPDGFALRLQTELIDLPWSWPCELNNLEAHAFCTYKSEQTGKKLRMLTEAEWMLLWERFVGEDQISWGTAPGNLNLEHYQSSCPVNKFSHGPFYDIVGNTWQHCETSVYPYPGYKVHPFYDDFSMPTFDNRHTCIKGGAWISTGNEATRDARFAFRRHFFQYVGLRYVEGVPFTNVYNHQGVLGLDPEVDAITYVSYQETFEGVPNGRVLISEYAKRQFKEYATLQPNRALDFACGSGRLSFELTSLFSEVIGVDFTARRLIPAFAMSERGMCTCSSLDKVTQKRVGCTVEAASYPWNISRQQATFYQGDPTNLHPHLKDFSLIVCWNTLEWSCSPKTIPSHLLGRLESGGLLIIGGHYTWNESVTPKREWLNEGDPEEEVFMLLGGEKTVERVGEPLEVTIALPEQDRVEMFRKVRLVTYRKK